MEDQTRNFNPHKAARLAACIFHQEYQNQSGGIMDFWDRLPEPQKNVCRSLLQEILNARDEVAIAPH